MRKILSILCLAGLFLVAAPAIAATEGSFALAPTVGAYASYGASTVIGADGSVSFWNGVWNIPISAATGSAVSSIVVPVRDNGASNGHSADPNVVTASLVLYTPNSESTLAFVASVGSGLNQTLTLTVSAPHKMLPGESLVLRLVPTTPTTPPRFGVYPSVVWTMTVVRQPIVVTMIVPIAPPTPSQQRLGLWQLITGIGATGQRLYTPIQMIAGSTITGIRARVKDGGSDIPGTRVQANLLKTPDGTEAFQPVASSALSSGAGQAETIQLSGVAIVAQPATNYYVEIVNQQGAVQSISKAYRLEVDYVPVTVAE